MNDAAVLSTVVHGKYLFHLLFVSPLLTPEFYLHVDSPSYSAKFSGTIASISLVCCRKEGGTRKGGETAPLLDRISKPARLPWVRKEQI